MKGVFLVGSFSTREKKFHERMSSFDSEIELCDCWVWIWCGFFTTRRLPGE